MALVQGRCGLVRNDQRRVPHEGPRCGHPLLLPHRQGVDRLVPQDRRDQQDRRALLEQMVLLVLLEQMEPLVQQAQMEPLALLVM